MPPFNPDALRALGARVEERFDGARIELPPRPPLRRLGGALTAFGAVTIVFMLFWMAGPISGAFRDGAPNLILLIFGLLGLPGLFMGLALLFGGLALWTGRSRCVVEISGGRLRVREIFPPLRWSWKRKVEAIRRFTVGTRPGETPDGATGAAARDWAQRFLMAEGSFSQPLPIGALYPAPVLRALADALAELCRRARPDAPAAPMVVAAEAVGGAPDAEPDAPRPPTTAVKLIEMNEGFAYDVPPAGVWRGSHGLFLSSLLWLAVCGFIFGIPFFIGKGRAIPPPVIVFAALFIGIGVAMLLGAIHLGRRRSMLAANAKTLGLRQTGLFGTKEQRVPRAEIAAIRCGPSGLEVNNRPVLELQIFRRAGGKIGGLSQLTEDELRWLAQDLRRRLGVPAAPPASMESRARNGGWRE